MRNPKPRRARSPWRRLRDAVLLPLALLLVAFEMALEAGARLVRRFGPLRRLEGWIASLPPWAILPLFLIPEGTSHVGGFYAAYLLAHHKFLAATVVAVLVKGVGFLIAIWIYQACRPALMTIRWFAWAHGKVEAARAWAMRRIGPAWRRARYVIRGVLARFAIRRLQPGARHSGRRLAAIRSRLMTQFARLRS